MTRSDARRLEDIREMCVQAADLVERGRSALDEDQALWLALERVVEVVGEAATQLADATKAQYPTADWKLIVRSRIIYAHQYHRIDRDLLWTTAEKSLPALLLEIGPVG